MKDLLLAAVAAVLLCSPAMATQGQWITNGTANGVIDASAAVPPGWMLGHVIKTPTPTECVSLEKAQAAHRKMSAEHWAAYHACQNEKTAGPKTGS